MPVESDGHRGRKDTIAVLQMLKAGARATSPPIAAAVVPAGGGDGFSSSSHLGYFSWRDARLVFRLADMVT